MILNISRCHQKSKIFLWFDQVKQIVTGHAKKAIKEHLRVGSRMVFFKYSKRSMDRYMVSMPRASGSSKKKDQRKKLPVITSCLVE